MISLDKQQGRRYYLVVLASNKPKHRLLMTTANCPSCFQVISPSYLWHCLLGHMSSSNLSFMTKYSLSFPFKTHNAYEACTFAKQSRLPFFTSSTSLVQHYKLIHYDIWDSYFNTSLFSTTYLFLLLWITTLDSHGSSSCNKKVKHNNYLLIFSFLPKHNF